MRKRIKFILYALVIILLLICNLIILNYSKNNLIDRNIYLLKENLINDIKNISIEEAFPVVDISLKENFNYLNNNFAKVNYNFNKNKNIQFTMFLPKYLNYKLNIGKDDPFESTDKNYIILGKVDDEITGISGIIYAFNTTLELDPQAINNSFFIDTLGYGLFKEKKKLFIDGVVNDMLTMNKETAQITRSIVYRSSSVYYILSFTFKNFYHYLEYKKDISVIFDSFNSKQFSKKLSQIDLNLTKIRNYDLLYPKGWEIKEKYEEDSQLTKISVYKKNKSSIFKLYLYDNIEKNSKQLAIKYLDIIKNQGIVFDGIDKTSIEYDEKRDWYFFKLKNAKDNNNIKLEVYIKIMSKNNRKIVSIMYTTKIKKDLYLRYSEIIRLFDLVTNSLALSLNDTKIEDTNLKNYIQI